MIEKRVKFAIDNFIEEGYFLDESSSYVLTEEAKGGRGELRVDVSATDNLCIAHFDEKHRCSFLRSDSKHSMGKCSDHILFTQNNHRWELVIIEMKSQIDENRLIEIRGKTRSTYLNALAIATFLGISISNVFVITTYEQDNPIRSPMNTTNPALFKMPLGKIPENDPIYDWFHDIISIDIGEETRKRFRHAKVKMERHAERQILVGSLAL